MNFSIWRANLFINEETNQSWVANSTPIDTANNYLDWNNQYPWIDGNEWNKIYRGQEDFGNVEYILSANYIGGKGDEKLAGLTNGNGGQTVNIVPFTWHRGDGLRTTNRDISNAVVYSYYSTSTPFEYDYEMEKQRRGINIFYQDVINNWDTRANGNIPQYLTTLSNWDTTLAPFDDVGTYIVNNAGGHRWENYVANEERPGLNNYISVNKSYNNPLGLDQAGYSNYPFQDNNTIGVDCGGLVYISASYLGNPYNGGNGRRVWLDCGRTGWTDYDFPNIVEDGIGEIDIPVGESNNLWEISNYNNTINLGKIVPGDIFYYFNFYPDYETSGRYYYHVAIVRDIEYMTTGSRSTTAARIHLIESVYGNNNDGIPFGNVINERTVGRNYGGTHWFIGRLKTNN